jgi:hypothetical protein
LLVLVAPGERAVGQTHHVAASAGRITAMVVEFLIGGVDVKRTDVQA